MMSRLAVPLALLLVLAAGGCDDSTPAVDAVVDGGRSEGLSFVDLTKSSPATVDWPLVLITTPGDAGLGGTNPRAATLPPGLTDVPIRVLAFAPAGIQTVEVQVDGGPWTPLTAVDAWLWQGSFTVPATTGKRKLEARALSPGGATGSHGITISVGP